MVTASRVLLGIAFTLMSSVSCVSVNLAKPDVKKATGVQYSAPGGNFKQFSPDHLDAAWKNSDNGNSISFLSDCEPKNDPPLSTIQKGIIQGIHNQKMISSDYRKYNGRKALFTQVKGEVDGIPSQVKLVILRKNRCIYVLTYVTLENHFSANLPDFDRFVERFHAP